MCPRVLLISMPWAPRAHSPIRLGVLKSSLRDNEIDCRTENIFLRFAETVGSEIYDYFSDRMLPGEWIFGRLLRQQSSGEEYLDYLAQNQRKEYEAVEKMQKPKPDFTDPEFRQRLLDLRNNKVPAFLTSELHRLLADDFDVVGFSCVANQMAASLSLSKLWKTSRPDTLVVFGGAQVQGVMGEECIRAFPWVDVVVDGEGELTFLELVRHHRSTAVGARWPAGVISRSNGDVIHSGIRTPIQDLDSVPTPDYSDYFVELNSMTRAHPEVVWVQMESSRGCWWGEKSQCRFCGVNGCNISFRSKSPARALLEIVMLSGQCKQNHVYLVDTIASKPLVSKAFPALVESGYDLNLFLEVHPTAKREELAMMKDAGVTMIQPGIESFSSEALRAMRKGTDALRNIRFLKWCRELGIDARYNLLWGLPDESRLWYESMAELFPSLVHLPPPNAPAQIAYQRDSPYFNEAVARDFRLAPLADYSFIYPEDVNTRAIAFLFEHPYHEQFADAAYIKPISAAIGDWRRRYFSPQRPLLSFSHGLDFVFICDSRWDKAHEFVLTGPAATIFLLCQDICSTKSIVTETVAQWGQELTRDQVEVILAELVRDRLLCYENDKYLNLALPEKAVRQEVAFVTSSILKSNASDDLTESTNVG